MTLSPITETQDGPLFVGKCYRCGRWIVQDSYVLDDVGMLCESCWDIWLEAL